MNVIKMAEGALSKDREKNLIEYGIDYLVLDIETKDGALNAVIDQSPRIYRGLVLNTVEYGGIKGEGIIINVRYGRKDAGGAGAVEDDDELQFSYSTMGGSVHINEGIKCTARYPDKGEEGVKAPDIGALIGWNGKNGNNSRIKGYDKFVCSTKKTITRKMKYKDFDAAYERVLEDLGCHVNNDKYMGREKGEVLYLGANVSGIMSSKELLTVQYDFLIAKNEKDVDLGNGVKVDKSGWSVLWNVPADYTEGDQRIIKPKWYYMTQVYPEGDLKKLGLKI